MLVTRMYCVWSTVNKLADQAPPTDQQIEFLKDVKEYSMALNGRNTLNMDEEPRTD